MGRNLFLRFCFPAVSLLIPFLVHAGTAIITEIMYDLSGADTGREWIEVQNNGGEAISFAQWRFWEANANHTLTLVLGEATTSAGSFAVFADNPEKFLIDWPDFSGTLFDSSFSLANTGEALALKSGDTLIDEVSYASTTGAAGDGNSLQKTSSGWIAAAPTPSRASVGGNSPASPTVSEQASSTPEQEQTPSAPSTNAPVSGGGSVWPLEPQIFVRARIPAHSVAGADVVFEADAVGKKKETLQNARYVWSFGDGGTAEGKKVLHAYHYPAAYVVMVEASSGEWSATDRKDITIAAPELAISRIQEGASGFIEVKNSGRTDIELSRWFFKSGSAFFSFPTGTIVPAGRSIPFPSEITKLTVDSVSSAILYPNGTVAAL